MGRLGLHEQQARAYLALLDVETAGVNELAKLSRVPRAKLYDVLDGLNRRGLVDIIPDTPQRYRANPVTALYDNRVEELRAEETELKRAVAELATQLVPLPKGDVSGPGRDFVHIGHGRTHFSVLAQAHARDAKKSFTVVGDRLLLARLGTQEELVATLVHAAQRVQLRIIVPSNVVESVEGRRFPLDEVRNHVRRANLTLGDALVMVRDETEYVVVRFLPNDLDRSRGSDHVEVGHDPEIASLWSRLAHAVWDAATPWKPVR